MPKAIRIDGVIGNGPNEINAAWVRSQLPEDGSEIAVKMHSEGGSVFEGFAIHDIFENYAGPKSLVIESSAFSIASFIAMAFDDVEITPNGYMMLHNPSVDAAGDEEDLAKSAALLSQLKANMVDAYAKRTGKSTDEINAILKAETYLNAQQAVEAGFVNRVAEKPIAGRVFARLDSMPHGVVTALFGAASAGENEPEEEEPMSDSPKTPVAATVKEIKTAFPKAKADFIVRCIERELPIASVASAAAEEMMTENEELQARVNALEEELAKAKAESETEPDAEGDDEAEAMEGDEKPAEAKARRTGVNPVARAQGGKPSASAQWSNAVQAKVSSGIPRDRATVMVDSENPGLRSQMIAEANAAR